MVKVIECQGLAGICRELATNTFLLVVRYVNHAAATAVNLRIRCAGWRPRRTLMFCAWGAEEAGLIGSREWVEVSLLSNCIYL